MTLAQGTVAVRVRVRGRVQGVGFRYSTVERAQRLGCAGWVANRHDGSVEAWLEGPAATVAAMIDWLRVGPSWAQVTDLQSQPGTPKGLSGFRVRS